MKNRQVVEVLESSLRRHAAQLNRKKVSIKPLDISSNDPSIIIDETTKHEQQMLEAISSNTNLYVTKYSTPAPIGKAYKEQKKNIERISDVIQKIAETVPLSRREDGSPDVAATCKAIKEHSEFLWEDLILYSLLPRSTWQGPLTKNAKVASFTPILLAAYKKEAKFSEWDTEENFKSVGFMFVALGTTLANMMYSRPAEKYEVPKDFIEELSIGGTSYTTRFSYETVFPRDGVRVSLNRPDLLDNREAVKPYVFMLSQTWIAHPSVRNSDTMILDIYDWDLIPEPFEVEEEEKVEWASDDL